MAVDLFPQVSEIPAGNTVWTRFCDLALNARLLCLTCVLPLYVTTFVFVCFFYFRLVILFVILCRPLRMGALSSMLSFMLPQI